MSFVRDLSNKYKEQLIDAGAKTGLDAFKTACKKEMISLDHTLIDNDR